MKILMLEDDPDDAELIQHVITRGKIDCEFIVAQNQDEFLEALKNFKPAIILSDNQLPDFNASEALEITRNHSLYLPFILVTGTVSEEFAANIIRKGADDYILKDRLARLPTAIVGAIERRVVEQNAIEQRKKAEEEILQMNEQLRDLSNHLQHIREEESARIAREIHDQLGQQLTVMKMDVAWIRNKVKDKDPAILEKTEGVLKMMDDTVKTVRRISADLRPSLLDEMGLGPAIESYLTDFSKRSGIKTEVYGANEDYPLDPEIISGLFRIVQESLTNVLRHAAASKVSVEMYPEDDSLVISIKDDGQGFEKADIATKKTLGLLGMKERVALFGGLFEVNSSKGKGTVVLVSVPNLNINSQKKSDD